MVTRPAGDQVVSADYSLGIIKSLPGFRKAGKVCFCGKPVYMLMLSISFCMRSELALRISSTTWPYLSRVNAAE